MPAHAGMQLLSRSYRINLVSRFRENDENQNVGFDSAQSESLILASRVVLRYRFSGFEFFAKITQ